MDKQRALCTVLDDVIDNHQFVPHRQYGIHVLANHLREEICEAHFSRSPTNLSLKPRTSDTFSMLREDPSHVRSYAKDNGISPHATSSARFDGAWCLWTTRDGEPDRQVLATRSAVDAPSALRATLHDIIGESFAHPQQRDRAVEERLTRRLHHAVDDWETTLKGHVTPRMFGDAQIRTLAREPEHSDIATAALNGDIVARRECFSRASLRDLERELDKMPESATWSLWTSKGHPQDSRLVLTNRSVDALSYHALHPHNRTRYLSFEGEPTPTRDDLALRALKLMPRESTLIIASDKTPEGRELATTITNLAHGLRHQRVEHHAPTITSWNHDLQLRVHERQSPAPRATALPARAVDVGIER
jgi:hypothetical protein